MAEYEAVLVSLKAGLPVLLLQLGVTFGLWLAGWRLMMLLVPDATGADMSGNNLALAVVRGGEGLALAMPLAACLSGSINATDILLWGSVVVILQLSFSLISRWWVRDYAARIAAGQAGLAVTLALARNGFALLNGAAVAG